MNPFVSVDADDAERQAAIESFIAAQRIARKERAEAVNIARPALARLIETFPQRTNQSYHLRNLLYSLWNGKPTSLSNVLNLDWSLRKDFNAVLLAFGHESKDCEFFYKAVQTALTEAGQFDWFLEASQQE